MSGEVSRGLPGLQTTESEGVISGDLSRGGCLSPADTDSPLDLVLLHTMTDKLVDMLMEIVYEWVVFILTSN